MIDHGRWDRLGREQTNWGEQIDAEEGRESGQGSGQTGRDLGESRQTGGRGKLIKKQTGSGGESVDWERWEDLQGKWSDWMRVVGRLRGKGPNPWFGGTSKLGGK